MKSEDPRPRGQHTRRGIRKSFVHALLRSASGELCLLGIGAKGEAQDKQQLIASNKALSTDVQNGTYAADEYKFDMPSADVVVMTHRGTTKGMQNGKEVTESHRSLHVFQKQNGRWQVVANAQLPIAE